MRISIEFFTLVISQFFRCVIFLFNFKNKHYWTNFVPFFRTTTSTRATSSCSTTSCWWPSRCRRRPPRRAAPQPRPRQTESEEDPSTPSGTHFLCQGWRSRCFTPQVRENFCFLDGYFNGKFNVFHSLLPRRPTDPQEGRPSAADSERQVRTRPLQVRHGFAGEEVLMFNRNFNDLVICIFFPGEHLRGGADGARNVRDPGGALFANANERRVKQNKITNWNCGIKKELQKSEPDGIYRSGKVLSHSEEGDKSERFFYLSDRSWTKLFLYGIGSG